MAVTFDIGAALKVARSLGSLDDALPRIQERATGTFKRRIEAEAGRAVSARFNVSPTIVRAGLMAVASKNVVELTGSGTALELIDFGGEWGGRLTPGASAQRLRGGPREVDRGSFIPTKVPWKHIMRRADSNRFAGVRVQRLPIKIVYGPSAGAMLLSPAVGSQLREFGARILTEEIDRLIAVELAGL